MFDALRAAAEVCLGRSDLEGLRVAVQGLGNVGMPLCGYLSVAGAALVVSDLDVNRCAQAAATYGATVAAPEEIHAQHVDVFAPAALGAVLNDATIPCLRCRVVCGGANNQLAEVRHDAALAERGKPFVEQTALARRLCIDKGMQIGNDGVQILGGHGFVKEHPVERWYRDLRAAGSSARNLDLAAR